MAITQVDKMKILKFFREKAFGDIYYDDLVEYLGKKSKISDVEFTNFFANYVIDSFNKEQPSLNLLCKMVSTLSSFIGWLRDDEVELDVELVTKLYSIREKYEQYLINSSSERNNKLDELISSFEKDLKNSYTLVEVEEEVTIDEKTILAELETLRNELADSEKEITELTTKLTKQTKAWENKKRDNNRLSSKLEESKKNQKKLEDKIKELEKIISQLNENIASLREDRTSYIERYDIICSLKDKIQNDYYSLKLEMKAMRKNLEEKDKEIAKLSEDSEFKIVMPRSLEFEEDRKNKIEALIIQKMLISKSTLEDIKEYLAFNGYILSLDELRRHFKAIGERLEYGVLDITEEIKGIELKENSEYEIPISTDTSCIDLMVVSDFHLGSFDKEIIHDMEILNDYCENNGIHYILDVGDFFSWTRLKGKHRGSVCQRIVDKAITKYPSRKGIKHAVLGGNHDKDMLAVGVDPIKMLADAREDFINLGYSHCKLTFGGSVSILDSIGMHHPNRRYPDPVGKDFYTTEKIRDSIDNYYAKEKIYKDDVYADLLGHIHKSNLDTQNGICIVPSYRKDRVLNGAWHLKVYFSDDKHISNIIFIPIIKTKELIATTEINYQKKLILK